MNAQKVWLVISPRNASGSREKKNGVGMALDVATLPLILYRKVYITIEHVLHCENIIHFISNVFSSCSFCTRHNRYNNIVYLYTVNDFKHDA